MVDMLKKLGKKGIIGIAVGAVVLVVIIALILILVLRIDGAEAQNIALQQTGGGEIVEQDISSEGLWNEYQYTIVNGDSWYEVEPSSGTNTFLMSRPSSILTGMFWRFGSVLLSLPVAVTVWLNFPWIRPSSPINTASPSA